MAEPAARGSAGRGGQPALKGKPGTIMGMPWWALAVAIVAGLVIGYFLLRPRGAQGGVDEQSPPSSASPTSGGGGGGGGLGMPGSGYPEVGGGGSAPSSSDGGGGGFDSSFLEDPGPDDGGVNVPLGIGETNPELTAMNPEYPNLVASYVTEVQGRDETPMSMVSIPSTQPGITSTYTVLSDTQVHAQSGTTGGRHITD
jgi:hypothetical protein